MVNQEEKMRTILTAVALLTIVVATPTKGESYDPRNIRDYGSCRVQSSIGLEKASHSITCLNMLRVKPAAHPYLSFDCNQWSDNEMQIGAALHSAKIPKRWGPDDAIVVKYRFDRDQMVVEDDWEGIFFDASMHGSEQEDSFGALTYNRNKISRLLARIETANILNFSIQNPKDHDTIVFPIVVSVAVRDFQSRCAELMDEAGNTAGISGG